MKKFLLLFLSFSILVQISCKKDDDVSISGPPDSISLDDSFFYSIDLNDRSGDTFKVTLFASLSETNNIFQFPATVPGIYATANFGRFIQDFRVFDSRMNRIPYTWVSSNQVEISRPEDVYMLTYEAADIWDSGSQIYRMSTTSLEDDHALLNTFAILGYPEGLKERTYFLEIEMPKTWNVGTSLETNEDGFFTAQNYDYLVDSPLLVGELSSASVTVDQTTVSVHTYSENGIMNASTILTDIEQVILDAQALLGDLPVDRYNFLFHFDDQRGAGALEHSFSSVYALQEGTSSTTIRSISAHEFFHVVTPLNIHSEIIEDFNFAIPTPSQHLWLYEGVTEWASDIMQFRNGSMNINSLLAQYAYKLEVNEKYYDLSYSLTHLSKTSYTASGNAQFGNVYNRGAMVAALLDIRLLELSSNNYGLRDFILDLIDTYGKENSFSETQFFDTMVTMTYPEIEDFIDSYIDGNDALPVATYFDKMGIVWNNDDYTLTNSTTKTDSQQAMFDAWSNN